MNNENQLTFEKIWKEARDKQAERTLPNRKSKKREDSEASEEATGRESTYGGL